jgi:hypothetical protein
MRAISAFAVLIFCSGCARETDDAVVAIFERNPKPPYHLCLAIGSVDPSPHVLAEAQAHNRKILPASQCIHSSSGYATKSGQRAQRLVIESVDWKSRKVAVIKVSSITGTLFGSSGWIYTVEKLSGFWVVTAEDMEWIS